MIVGDCMGESQLAVPHTINRVSRALANQSAVFIRFQFDNESIRTLKQNYYQQLQIPGVIVAIDCTHVRMTPLSAENVMVFLNRKSYYSINTQVMCDAGDQIMDIVATVSYHLLSITLCCLVELAKAIFSSSLNLFPFLEYFQLFCFLFIGCDHTQYAYTYTLVGNPNMTRQHACLFTCVSVINIKGITLA